MGDPVEWVDVSSGGRWGLSAEDWEQVVIAFGGCDSMPPDFYAAHLFAPNGAWLMHTPHLPAGWRTRTAWALIWARNQLYARYDQEVMGGVVIAMAESIVADEAIRIEGEDT